jgi:hypothetical protein
MIAGPHRRRTPVGQEQRPDFLPGDGRGAAGERPCRTRPVPHLQSAHTPRGPGATDRRQNGIACPKKGTAQEN